MLRSRGVFLIAVAAVSIGAGCAHKKVATAKAPETKPVVEQPAPAQVAQPRQETPKARAATPPAVRPSATPDAATRARIDQLLARIEDAYFDYDKHTLRPDAIEALRKDSTELRDILKDYPDYKLTIEGHADERGSAEYNMALGQARAEAAKAYLVQVGIPSQQLGIVSYGKERPACQEQTEDCYQKNRRIHIVANAATR